MFDKIIFRIAKRWMENSEVQLLNKENGFLNIEIRNKNYGVLILHPIEEREEPDREDGFSPFSGYYNRKIKRKAYKNAKKKES
jgi:hypothetical protein